MTIVEIASTTSTNSWLAENSGSLTLPTLVYALEQTAGRGQRGNSWEAETGKNLTASVLLVPAGVEPQRQFVISEAVALAVSDTLRELGVETKVKWPNDIYAGDKKICGILIEHSIMGRKITRTIAGVGVNINQEVFCSDAPNPVSVVQITGKENPIAGVAQILGGRIEARISQIPAGTVHAEFMRNLWRGDGAYYPFYDKIRHQKIEARISDIAENGILSLLTADGEIREYAFKEVEFILDYGKRY
ncbi:MAG: biotin--[acetyl-CoA-carboxylase] ligase [Bacteroides sp.]|nr:biotin--[acetyl-CoA-carboxylase] ligase [Bacteroides sp.]